MCEYPAPLLPATADPQIITSANEIMLSPALVKSVCLLARTSKNYSTNFGGKVADGPWKNQ